MERVDVRWERGGEATFIAVRGDAIELVSSVPAPPGSRIDGVLACDGTRVRVKVHGSARRDDGTFAWTARAIDWTRAVREKVSALAAGRGAP